MNRLLILFFVISSVSCLHHYAPDATKAAQSILDTIDQAYSIPDNALLLSVFDKSFNANLCNLVQFTYKGLEETKIHKNVHGVKVYIEDAKFTEDGLQFYVVEQPPFDDKKFLVFAKEVDGMYKIYGAEFVGAECK